MLISNSIFLIQNQFHMQNHSHLIIKSHLLSIYNAKKTVSVVFILLFCLFSCDSITEVRFSTPLKLKKHIKINMQEQENAWNEGDLEGFMKHYWKSDSLRFIGNSGLNKGWQKTLDNYKRSYKNKEEMGTLKFTNKSIEILGEESIFVIGGWHLMRQDSLGDLKGMYSLIWQQKNGKWVITADHSS